MRHDLHIEYNGKDITVVGDYTPAEPETGLNAVFEIEQVLYFGLDIKDFINDLAELEEKCLETIADYE